jgi:syntaxin 1B/2/3
MIELAQLFQDVEAAVIQHEPAVEEIEQKAEATHDNVGKATVEIDGAIAKARSRRRKQWWCLGILCKFSLHRIGFDKVAIRVKFFWLC